jgi:hypothetical protein
VDASLGLEIVWNRATRGIWNFSVSVSEVLAFHAGTMSHMDGLLVNRALGFPAGWKLATSL